MYLSNMFETFKRHWKFAQKRWFERETWLQGRREEEEEPDRRDQQWKAGHDGHHWYLGAQQEVGRILGSPNIGATPLPIAWLAW